MDMREAITAQTSFSLHLSSHLLSLNGTAGSNLAFSPLSLHSVLSLLIAGSSGLTHQQLLWFLGSPLASSLVALYFQISNSILVDGSAAGGPCVRYAGGVWMDANANLKNSFREVAGSAYKAEAHSVSFRNSHFAFLTNPEECRNEINNWVEQITAGHIKDLLPSGSVTVDTQLVLGNAMYFKGLWAAKFDPLYTKINTFHLINGSSVETPFMASSEKQFIEVYDGFKVLRLPYKQGQDWRQFSFYIFLPDNIHALSTLSMKMSSEPDFLNRHIPTGKVPVGNFRIPKFKISMGIDFSEIFKNMGLVLPFEVNGDLSEMVDSLDHRRYYVSHIAHKCFVEVNEEGTEAAAASGGIIGVTSIQQPIDFVADHPFLFLIREDRSGVVLFMGHILNPLLAG